MRVQGKIIAGLVAAVAILRLLYCSAPNPFTADQARCSIVLESGSTFSTDSISDTTGNSVRIGFVPYLAHLIDSVGVTIRDSASLDTSFRISSFSAEDDTVWISRVFLTAGRRSVVVAVHAGGATYVDSAVISISASSGVPAGARIAITSGSDTANLRGGVLPITPPSIILLNLSTKNGASGRQYSYALANGPGVLSGPAFFWQVQAADTGAHLVKFTMTESGTARSVDTASMMIEIRMNRIANGKPVFAAGFPVGSYKIPDGGLLVIPLKASDPDHDGLAVFLAGATDLPHPTDAVLTDSLLTWQSQKGDSGRYTVTFGATDRTDTAFAEVTITIGSINGPPALAVDGRESGDTVTVSEGDSLILKVRASDPDPDQAVTLSMTGASSSGPGTMSFNTSSGRFVCAMPFGAVHGDTIAAPAVRFIATDNGTPPLADTVIIAIRALNINRPPRLEPLVNKSIGENQQVRISVRASDPDGDAVKLFVTSTNLPRPDSCIVTDSVVIWSSRQGDSGNYRLVVGARDAAGAVDSAACVITVGNLNSPPQIAIEGIRKGDRIRVIEESGLTFTVTASDPNSGDQVILKFAGSIVPTCGAALFDPSNGGFYFKPVYACVKGDSAVISGLSFIAVDNGSPALGDTFPVSIVVLNKNRPPVMQPSTPVSVDENALVTLKLAATDPDSQKLRYESALLPAGSRLNDSTGVFTWTPDYTQGARGGKVYLVLFSVTDGEAIDTTRATITVNQVNRPPELDSIRNRSAKEGELLSFTLAASDPDGDSLRYRAIGLPRDATLDSVRGALRWTPAFGLGDQSFSVLFVATDGVAVDSERISLKIDNNARPPVLDSVGSKTVAENQTLTITISANSPDKEAITIASSALPTGAQLTKLTDSTARLTWKPGYDQAGAYPVTVYARTSFLADSERVTLTVTNVNRAPYFSTVPPRGDLLFLGSAYARAIAAGDSDAGSTLAISVVKQPSGGTMTYNSTAREVQWLVDPGAYAAGAGDSATIRVSDGSLTRDYTWTFIVKPHTWRTIGSFTGAHVDMVAAKDSQTIALLRREPVQGAPCNKYQIQKTLNGGSVWTNQTAPEEMCYSGLDLLECKGSDLYFTRSDMYGGVKLLRQSLLSPGIGDSLFSGFSGIDVSDDQDRILAPYTLCYTGPCDRSMFIYSSGSGQSSPLSINMHGVRIATGGTVFGYSRYAGSSGSGDSTVFYRSSGVSASGQPTYGFSRIGKAYFHLKTIITDANNGDTLYMVSRDSMLYTAPNALSASLSMKTTALRALDVVMVNGKTGWMLGIDKAVYFTKDAFVNVTKEIPISSGITPMSVEGIALAADKRSVLIWNQTTIMRY